MYHRRDVLRIGAGIAAAAAFPPRLFFQPAGLITKKIPASGEPIPAIGVGTRNYRSVAGGDLAPYRKTIEAFLEAGGKVVDTAPSYGNSEQVLGTVLGEQDRRAKVFLATKVDRVGRDAGLARMEASLKDLATDRVELMQVHNLVDVPTQLATLREWKARGRIRYLGVTTSSDSQYEELEGVLKRETLDFVQLDFALDHRLAAQRLLPLAADRGVGVLVNLPFGRGRLFQAVGSRPLPEWAAELDCASWAQFFLKYVISHPAVTCAIPGMTKPEHAVDNMTACRGRLPDSMARRRMEQLIDGL